MTFSWQVQSNIPSVVGECLLEWNDGITLDDDAKRLIDRHADCAKRNPHIWFCPHSPAGVVHTAWSSLLQSHHKKLSLNDCWYDQTHRTRRRLSMENVTHNTLPPMDYARDTVNAWLTEFPVSLRLLSSLPNLGDDCKVELQEDLFRQTHSISIKNL